MPTIEAMDMRAYHAAGGDPELALLIVLRLLWAGLLVADRRGLRVPRAGRPGVGRGTPLSG